MKAIQHLLPLFVAKVGHYLGAFGSVVAPGGAEVALERVMAYGARWYDDGKIPIHRLVKVIPLGPGGPAFISRVALAAVLSTIPCRGDQGLLLCEDDVCGQ